MSADGRDDILAPLATSAIAWCGFDAAWYRLAAGLPDSDDAALLAHYLATGRHAGLAPNMYFDEAWYRARNPDVATAIAAGAHASGYAHYCAIGYLTGSAHWLYDDDIYRLHAADLTDQVLVAYGCANRYDHYLKAGASEHRPAHRLFQPARYCAALGADAAEIGHPFRHYLQHLWAERADTATSLYFDPVWYLAHCPAARAAIAAGRALGALHHFLTAADAGDPLPEFSAAHYAAGAPDHGGEGAAGIYDHFLKSGVHRLASPAPGIDLGAYLAAHLDAREAVQSGALHDVFAHFLARAPQPVGRAQAATSSVDVVAAAAPPTMPAPAYLASNPAAWSVGIDATVFCPHDGMVLNGWLLAPAGLVAGLHLVCGMQTYRIDLARCVTTARQDVLELHRDAGYDDPDCGFLAFILGDFPPGERMFLEVRLADDTTVIRDVPPPVLHGMSAIRTLLDRFDLRYDALRAALGAVMVPAIARLGAAFNAQALALEVIGFGAIPADPGVSLIIPLHGRLDFMEIQLALLSRDRAARGHDILYVLDDPPRRRAAEQLAAACFARFEIPFRLVVLGRNAGYAAANNAGLALARGRHVALVNSDVFPAAAGDFDQLAAHLDADPGLGAVGPLLLFEDGAVQHQGMAFERLAEFAGMHFPLHPRKGLLPPADTGLHRVPAITGACMVLRREQLVRLGGLDPAFLIGDFEDADLCLRLASDGMTVAVDHGVRMHHLERQSQAGSEQRWRMNLTLYNAWTHEQRWGATLIARAPT